MLIFDIGGTFIKYAIFNEGNLVFKNKIPTPSAHEITACLNEITSQLRGQYQFKSIGISSAGQIDRQCGKVIYAGATMPGYTGTELKRDLEKMSSCKVTVLNDVEACMYNYNTAESVLYIAIGTGIGGAYLHNNQVHVGDNNFSLEIGHLFHPKGDEFENICSTKALLNKYYQITNNQITGEELDHQYQSDNPTAIKIIDEYLSDLAIGIINVNYILDCNRVILGGGIVDASFFKTDLIQDYIIENCPNGSIVVEKSSFGNDAPLYGMYNYIKNNN